jgi:hypothetical protein
VSGKHHKQPLKAKRHARGTRGPQGPAGPEGPEGPAGVNGKNGTNGKAGANGTNGTPGKSVLSGQEPSGENCEQGGYWFEIQGTGIKQYVCNGSGGSGGGSGGTTLAPGATVTGPWSFGVPKGGWDEVGDGSNTDYSIFTSISFPLAVPDVSVLGTRWVGQPNWLEPGEEYDTVHCPGSENIPKAAPGFLCYYAATVVNAGRGNVRSFCEATVSLGATNDTANGVTLRFCLKDPSSAAYGYGTWAVTAELEE